MSVPPISAVSSSAKSVAQLLASTVALPTDITLVALADIPVQIQSQINELEQDQINPASGVSQSQVLRDIQLLEQARSQQAQNLPHSNPAPAVVAAPPAELASIPLYVKGTLLDAHM